MTEEATHKPAPSDVCPRCHGVKEMEEGLCENCRVRDEARRAEEEVSANPGDYATGLSRNEYYILTSLLLIGSIGAVVLVYLNVAPQVREWLRSYSLPPAGDVLKALGFVYGGIVAQLIIVPIIFQVRRSYHKHLAKTQAAKGTKSST